MQVTKPNSDQPPAASFGACLDSPFSLVPPASVHLKGYAPCDFSLPPLPKVPDPSRLGIFLESVSAGSKNVSQALAGASSSHQQVQNDELSPSKKASKGTSSHQQAQIEEDSADSSDDEPSPSKKATTVVTPLVANPRVALATVAAFGISGVADILAKQCNHKRRAALELRARVKEDRIEAAEFAVAKAEILHKNTASANRDALSLIKEQHQFIGTQLKIQADTRLAAHMALLETNRQSHKDCRQFRLEQEAMQHETELAVQEQNVKGTATNARCFENNQQLFMHLTDRCMDDLKESRQIDLARERQQQEYSLRSLEIVCAVANKALERIPIHSAPISSPSGCDTADSISQKVKRIEDTLSREMFWCPLAAHGGMRITVYGLLTEEDRFKKIPIIEQQLTQGVKAYIEDCAQRGEEITFEHLLTVMLPCQKRSSWRVWNFVSSMIELFSRRERPSLERAPLLSFILDVFTTPSELSIEESRRFLKEILRLYTPYGDESLFSHLK